MRTQRNKISKVEEGKRKMDCQSFLNGVDIEKYNMFK